MLLAVFRRLLPTFLACLATQAHAEANGWLEPVQQVARWLEPGQHDPPNLHADLELVSRASQPRGISNTLASLSLRVPDRFRLLSGTNGSPARIELGRNATHLWLWEPARRRFSRSRLPSDSGPIGLASASTLLAWASHGCDSSRFSPLSIEGLSCTPYRVRPGNIARAYLGTTDFNLTLWIHDRAQLPLAIRWQEPSLPLDLTVWMRRPRIDRSPAGSWPDPTPPTGIRPDDIPLESLRQRIPPGMHFIAVELGALPPAPPATTTREMPVRP